MEQLLCRLLISYAITKIRVQTVWFSDIITDTITEMTVLNNKNKKKGDEEKDENDIDEYNNHLHHRI